MPRKQLIPYQEGSSLMKLILFCKGAQLPCSFNGLFNHGKVNLVPREDGS